MSFINVGDIFKLGEGALALWRYGFSQAANAGICPNLLLLLHSSPIGLGWPVPVPTTFPLKFLVHLTLGASYTKRVLTTIYTYREAICRLRFCHPGPRGKR